MDADGEALRPDRLPTIDGDRVALRWLERRDVDDLFGLARLEADVDPRNLRSLALLERHGFRREGYLRERWRVGGEVQDSVLLGLLARERPTPR